MYAVVRTGGKQYRVGPGDILEVEKLTGKVGDSVVLDDVLLVSSGNDVRIGQPNVDGASVTAKITGQHRAEKILAFRYRPKKRVRVRRGHRQYLTRLQIHKISGEDFEFVEEVQKVAAPQPVAEEVEPVAAVDEVEAPVAIVADTDAVTEAEETTAAGPQAEADEAANAVDALKETVAKAGDVVDETISTAGDVLEDTVDKADEVLDDTVDKADDILGGTVDKAGDVLESAVDKAGDVLGDTVDKAGDVLESAVDKAGDVLSDTVDKAGDVLEDVAASIRKLPFVGTSKSADEEESASDTDDAETDEKKEE